jgi:ABC-2 type transport system permease protein
MVWVLLAIAAAGIALLAIIAFLDSGGRDLEAARAAGEHHPAVMTDWWIAGGGDSVLTIGAVFLLMGGLIGGAGVIGGEWRSGSIATVLTWEPRRVRLLATRFAAMATCSFAIALALQLVLLLAMVPAVVVHGTTTGADAAFAASLGAAMARIAAMTALGTLLGAGIASITRSTAGGILAVWVWVALVESTLRARKPWMSSYLLSENVVRVVSWADLPGITGTRSPAAAAGLLALYAAGLALVAAVAFRRVDIVAG